MIPLRVGDKLYGYCGGEFGRDSYSTKTVEAIGSNWVVAREENNQIVFYEGPPEDLLIYTTEEERESWEERKGN